MGLEDFGLTDGPEDDNNEQSPDDSREIKPKSEQGTKAPYAVKADLEVVQKKNNSNKIISHPFIKVLKAISDDIVSNGVKTTVTVMAQVEAINFAEAMREADYEFKKLEDTVEKAMNEQDIEAAVDVKMSTYRT